MCSLDPVSIPIEKYADEELTYLPNHVSYREAIGCLMYLEVATRPNIVFAVNHLSQFLEEPGVQHWVAIKRIFGYLIGSLSYDIEFGKCT